MTVGRNYNTADYFTVEDPTYANESYRDFVRFGNTMELSNKLNIAFGFDAEKIYYNTNGWSKVQGSTEVQTEITEPGLYYAEDDTNKVRPLYDQLGVLEFESHSNDGDISWAELEKPLDLSA